MIETMFSHSILGLCAWDLPALLVLITMVVVFLGHRHKQKKREKDFEEQLSDKLAEDTVVTPEQV